MKRRPFGIGVLFLLLAVRLADAQVASLGKGWLLDTGGSITSAPGEVISGKNSIKASGTSPVGGLSTYFLVTDPTFVRLPPNQSYTMSFGYRIITSDGGGFQYGFQSSEGGPEFGLDAVLKGASSSSGTVTNTIRLNNHGDYHVIFTIDGRGSIVIDDVRITDSNGQLVASENAEGPSLAPGPLNFQVTDAIALLTPARATALAAAAKDLDGDGYPETLLTLYGTPSCGVPLQPIIIESSARMRLATSEFFPAGAPTNNCTPMVQFADINNDGLTDIVFADAGLDAAPFTGYRIGVALNVGGGKYRDVSSLIPADQQTTRSYAFAVGDIFGDGRAEIILPDENDGANTVLLRWNGNGFDEIRNWIPQSIWRDGPALLHAQSWMSLADFDRDGRLDLLVTGQDHNPNFQIVFGGPGGFTAGTLVVLPDGPFGHTQGGSVPDGTLTTAEVSPVVVADFNNDGMPDIFAINRNITLFTSGCPTANPCRFFVGDSTYQVRLNRGSRNFVDVSPSPFVNLGRVEYQNLMTVDLNNDGFLDVVGTYSTEGSAGASPQWGTTLFLNDGTGAFQLLDGAQFIGATTTPPNGNQWGLRSFVPTVVSPGRTEGIVYQTVFGGQARGLNLFKVVANGALGTGPNFVNPATLGVPGFNEFYYLRHYPDAAAAVQAGQYSSGLAHYVAVGAAKGYQPHAPRAIVSRRAPNAADLDGDARADLAVFRPATGTWFTLQSGNAFAPGTGIATALGQTGDIPVPGDYDGSGQTDLAVYRPGNGTWNIRFSSSGTMVSIPWGRGTDIPVPGDYDGDGRTDLAFYRPSTGVWWILTSRSSYASSLAIQFGKTGDVPVPGDYDGDGTTDLAVFRPLTGTWSVRKSSDGGATPLVAQWGLSGDVPVPADYDGDHITDLAVFRPSDGTWYMKQSTTNFTTTAAYQWGLPGDMPVPADYDGDALADVAVYRPSNGTWYIKQSTTSFTTFMAYQWGLGADIPAPNVGVSQAVAISKRTVANVMRNGDLDGDGRADLTVFRSGQWFTLTSSQNFAGSAFHAWGLAGDIAAPGDFDGDGQTDLTVWRPSNGTWYILTSSSNFGSAAVFQFGLPGDTPVVGDFDGDGRADPAVFRPSTGTWFFLKSSTNFTAFASFQWGLSGDVPVPGDYDGDGISDLAVYRPSIGTWFVRLSSTGFVGTATFQWGLGSDIAVPGDYDGDGRTDLAVFRPSTGTWFIRWSTTGYATSVADQLGVNGDIPVPGDFDGDGRIDLAVFRPSTSTWFFLTSSSGFTTFASVPWGIAGDVPILHRP